MPVTPSFAAVEEFQGLYGPFQVSELLIQRIWLKRAFNVLDLRDTRGRLIEIEYPGDWNRLEGPDFKNAILSIDGERFIGDVEVHFSLSDWEAHGHGMDSRYDRVRLHVLYHLPPEPVREARTRSGHAVPSISLMPRLWYDLEEYADQDSIVSSTGTENAIWFESILELSQRERLEALMADSRDRWSQKRAFAGLRIERLGWSAACHQTAMEIMGYRYNRIPMLELAGRYTLRLFEKGSVRLDYLWGEVGEGWRLTGCRPANHPRTRLEQYLLWCSRIEGWPRRLGAIGCRLGSMELEGSENVAKNRKALEIKQLRESIAVDVVGECVGGSKLDTLICDGFLPLLAAWSGEDLFDYWFSWYVGNVPESCRDYLGQLQVLEAGNSPASNGWVQGLLKRMFH